MLRGPKTADCPKRRRSDLMAGELAFFELGVEDPERGRAF
jgi:hypothetical protein